MKAPARIIIAVVVSFFLLLAAPQLLPRAWALLGERNSARSPVAASVLAAPKAMVKKPADAGGRSARRPETSVLPEVYDCDSILSCPPGEVLVASPSLVSCAEKCTVAQCCIQDGEAEIVEVAYEVAVSSRRPRAATRKLQSNINGTVNITSTSTTTSTTVYTTATTITTVSTSPSTTSTTATTATASTSGTHTATTLATTTTTMTPTTGSTATGTITATGTSTAAGTSTATTTTDGGVITTTGTGAATTATVGTSTVATGTNTATGTSTATTTTSDTTTSVDGVATTGTGAATTATSGTTATTTGASMAIGTTTTTTTATTVAMWTTAASESPDLNATMTETSTSAVKGASDTATTVTTMPATTATTTATPTTTVTLTVPASAGSIQVKGMWTLEVVSGDAVSLVTNPDMVMAVQLAVAGQVGVASDLVEVTLSEGSLSRRLRSAIGARDAQPRRLEGQMVAAYVITFPADEQGISDANAAADGFSGTTAQQLTSALESAMSSISGLLGDTFTLVVKAFDAPSLVIVAASSTQTTTLQSGVMSPALPRSAPLSITVQLVVVIVVLAMSKVMVEYSTSGALRQGCVKLVEDQMGARRRGAHKAQPILCGGGLRVN
eukprot:CAMPEP_0180689428 /NCGR_PEP_ID=MMETSP1037_2-20121125/74500_1 /TAXON_ID=632150 /ORGANISM="Azadinium spinosum, Strain 3D9" /LENGTH=614 /DNA_ID=CAMNT_0022720317 /DNA_START=34 /DNA_END=1879 /DNA_ORIENTATION=-